MDVPIETLRQWEQKGLISKGTLSTQEESFQSPPRSRPPSKLSPSECVGAGPALPVDLELRRPVEELNKTEKEFLQMLIQGGWLEIETHPMKLRLGPEKQRCDYTPDFCAVNPLSGQFTLFECKGAFEYEDARVKRMTCARLCQRWGWAFVYGQKTKQGWKYEGLA